MASALLQNKFISTTIIAANSKRNYENQCLKSSFFLMHSGINANIHDVGGKIMNAGSSKMAGSGN